MSNAIKCISSGDTILIGRLKRIQKQLRIESGLLTKSGRPVIPPKLRKVIVSAYHNPSHFGTEKVYSLLNKRFYWPNMFNYIRSFIQGCVTCQKTKTDSRPPKAPLVPMFVPTAPMQLVSLDIGYLPKDGHGYQYILLIGDTFSKFIQAISLKDQTAPVIADAFLKNWVYIHGTPSYLLTDQGSNVDGQLMRDICTTLGIEKGDLRHTIAKAMDLPKGIYGQLKKHYVLFYSIEKCNKPSGVNYCQNSFSH